MTKSEAAMPQGQNMQGEAEADFPRFRHQKKHQSKALVLLFLLRGLNPGFGITNRSSPERRNYKFSKNCYQNHFTLCYYTFVFHPVKTYIVIYNPHIRFYRITSLIASNLTDLADLMLSCNGNIVDLFIKKW